MIVYLIVALLATINVVQAADWAVLVAGSNTYDNYRHQADMCHSYHVVSKNGIPDERIITFMYDDIANSPSNPFPGEIFNKPTTNTPGVNVYAKVPKHYTGDNVTPENFLAVLTGNSSAVPPGMPVLQSTAEDRVFIFFSDHGASGLIAFPNEYLYSNDLMTALQYMYDNKLYSKLVFYLEACESGSMFQNLLPTNWNMYATTAANADESSWGTYCPPSDMVNGVELNSCLGDLYSVNWMENTDEVGPTESLEKQFTIVQNLTDQSHVMQFGQLTFTNEEIGDFQGDPSHRKKHHTPTFTSDDDSSAPSVHVSSRDIPVHLSYYRYIRSKSSAERKANLVALRAQLDAREHAEQFFMQLAQYLSAGIPDKQIPGLEAESLMNPPVTPVITGSCIKSAVNALKQTGNNYDDFSLQYHRIIVNACRYYSKHHESDAENFVVTQIKRAASE